MTADVEKIWIPGFMPRSVRRERITRTVANIYNLLLTDPGPRADLALGIFRYSQYESCLVTSRPDDVLVISTLCGVRVVWNAKMVQVMQCEDKRLGPAHGRVVTGAEE